MRPTFIQSTLILNGVILTFAGISLLIAPQCADCLADAVVGVGVRQSVARS